MRCSGVGVALEPAARLHARAEGRVRAESRRGSFGDVQALAFGGATAAQALAAAANASGAPLPIFAAADVTRVSTASAAAVPVEPTGSE